MLKEEDSQHKSPKLKNPPLKKKYSESEVKTNYFKGNLEVFEPKDAQKINHKKISNEAKIYQQKNIKKIYPNQKLYKQSSMSMKSSNPIVTQKNKIGLNKWKNKKNIIDKNKTIQENDDDDQKLMSNKSVKFTVKNSSKFKRNNFNISESKSRISSFSEDMFPDSLNFTYDLGKNNKKKIRENFEGNINKTVKQSIYEQNDSRSLSKPIKSKKSNVLRNNEILFQQTTEGASTFKRENFGQKNITQQPIYNKVIYTTQNIVNNQINLICKNEKKHNHSFEINENYQGSYNYSKKSSQKYLF